MTSGPVTCVYRAYEGGELVATGRLVLDELPSVDDEVPLNGRVRVVRFTVRWDQVAPKRPANPRSSADPAYRWGTFGDVLDGLHALGIPVLVTLYGSPGWANGHRPPNGLPLSGFGDFAYAAARRFPWVRMWSAWNEPNSRTFAVPVSPAAYVRRVLDPAYASLHSASRANRVAGGETSPRITPSGKIGRAHV